MNVVLHLVALPWSPLLQPSIVLGCLRAYVDRSFGKEIPCYSYSAFIEVVFNALGERFLDFYSEKHAGSWAEAVAQFIYFEEFKKGEVNKEHRKHFAKLVRQEGKQFSLKAAQNIRKSLKNYVETRIVPNLEIDKVNVVGMTMTMQQCYFSAFVGKYLKINHPEFNFVFLYGGASTSSVNVARIFMGHNIPGYFVIGEGEEKLISVIKSIQDAKGLGKNLEEHITRETQGVLSISSKSFLRDQKKNLCKTQVDIASLPDPDYEEYFDTLKRLCVDKETYNDLKNLVHITLEGSRGCISNCDFCSLNRVWHGFRQRSPNKIVQTALSKTYRYNCNKVIFIDNICDRWAAEYANALIARNRRILASMELRVDHPESFWTKLAITGIEQMQLGIEAFSPPLLKAIGKGTTVVQNIVAQKYLKELNIRSRSNIITDHPKSTIKDIKYTEYVLDHLPHLDQYNLSCFLLTRGSPLYVKMSNAEKAKLKDLYVFQFKGLYQKYQISDFFAISKDWLKSKTHKAWVKFTSKYEERKRELQKTTNRMDIIQCSDEMLWIKKISNGRRINYKFDKRFAAVYELCHQGMQLESICNILNLPRSEVQSILWEFIKEKLMIDIEGVFISLALRPKDVLIRNLYQTKQKDSKSVPVQKERLSLN